MKVSFKYLKNHVDLSDITPEELAAKLTFAGAEVEEVSPFAQGTHLVIGHVLSCLPHPDSDHLHVLQVDEGPEFGVHQIVCGAPNAREGLNVIVARNGAKLPGGEIKPSKIRGVESDGMCCSLLELGVDRKYLSDYQCSGIEELPSDAPVGSTDVLGYLGLDDVALDLSILPNRPDLYSFENVCREVSCLLERPFKAEEVSSQSLTETAFHVGSSTEKCPLFTARVIRGVKTKESPLWMKRMLETCGIRSINNVVDIGNYIMLLTGQPLNMYDLDKLPVPELIVRDDLSEDFLAMDGNRYPLEKGDLVVTSGGKPMCLAGIMTADACRVDENTQNLVVEAAYFDGASIRRTSNRIGLSSDSSLRFCKGINPDQMEYVQAKTSESLLSLADADQVSETISYDALSHAEREIETSFSYINGRLGTNFQPEEILRALKRDNLVADVSGDKVTVKVPSYRIDMDGQADVTEEVIRILGLDNIKSEFPSTRLSISGLTEKQRKKNDVRSVLRDLGMNEVLTYTLVSEATSASFRYLSKAQPYRLKNPLTVERSFVRPSLLPSLLETAAFNVARQNKDFGLFEISDIDAHGLQTRYLAGVLIGNRKDQGRIGEKPFDFFDAKGLIESVFEVLDIKANRYSLVSWSLGGEEMHPGRSAEIRIGKKLVGYLGELHPTLSKRLGLKTAVVFELDFEELCNVKTGNPKAVVPAKYPSVSRDLAILLDQKVDYQSIKREVLKSSALISEVQAFDVYQGKGIPDGKKSLALALTLSSLDHTLKEAEISEAVAKAIQSIKVKFGAEIRGE